MIEINILMILKQPLIYKKKYNKSRCENINKSKKMKKILVIKIINKIDKVNKN